MTGIGSKADFRCGRMGEGLAEGIMAEALALDDGKRIGWGSLF